MDSAGLWFVCSIVVLRGIQYKFAQPHRARSCINFSVNDSSDSPVVNSALVSSIPDPPEDNQRKNLDVAITDIHIHELVSLRDKFTSANVVNNIGFASTRPKAYNKEFGKEDFIIETIVRKKVGGNSSSSAYVRAGPRSTSHFHPKKVRAAIISCGGLCPGLNNVIRELVHALHHLYGVESVIGIRGGFNGFLGKPECQPIELTVASVSDIHHLGGTILGTSRGGFDEETILSFLETNGINQLYVIGGDGTHRGADIIAKECIKRDMNVSVVGIPKTIDNDVGIIDRSFGFTTSVETAQQAILSAKTEAKCNMPNGVGIVKLMGRSAGFIAVHATMASGDVDLCLVPEVKIELEGERGCLPFLLQRVKEQGHAVVVVAEGAGEDILGRSNLTDAGGNRQLPAIGEFMKFKIAEYFKAQGTVATVKYIDPSYMIRSVPANASDALLCMLLAQNSVHGAMAGYTAFSTGLVNNRVVYIPIQQLVSTSPNCMDALGRTWERIIAMTRQPNTETAAFSLGRTKSMRTII